MKRLGTTALAVCLLAAAPAVLVTTNANASACTVQANCIKVGTAFRMLDGTNTYRSTNQLIKYDRTGGQTVSPANQWGYEVAVVGGKVTAVADGKTGMAIPVNGYVLSGHGTEDTWLFTNAKVGATVTLPGGAPPPTPTPSPTPTTTPTAPLPPTGSWQGQYWDNATLTGTPVLTRTDAAINFGWAATEAAGLALHGGEDSARWTQSINFDAADYTFTATGDDGIRVKVDWSPGHRRLEGPGADHLQRDQDDDRGCTHRGGRALRDVRHRHRDLLADQGRRHRTAPAHRRRSQRALDSRIQPDVGARHARHRTAQRQRADGRWLGQRL